MEVWYTNFWSAIHLPVMIFHVPLMHLGRVSIVTLKPWECSAVTYVQILDDVDRSAAAIVKLHYRPRHVGANVRGKKGRKKNKTNTSGRRMDSAFARSVE